MKRSSWWVVSLALFFSVFSNASVSASELRHLGDRANIELAAAVVETVDVENRIVTLRGLSNDNTIVMGVGDEVSNLAEVEVGDTVVVEYLEAIAFDLKKGGGLEPTASIATAAGRANPGEKPASAVGEFIQIVATVLAIDPDEPSATLKGPDGGIVEVLVRDPQKLVGVDIGDQVVITYSRALVIGVQAASFQ